MKKVLTFVIVLIVLLALSGCKESSYESNLLDMGTEYLADFRNELSYAGERTYGVTYNQGTYTIDLNGEEYKVQNSGLGVENVILTNEEDCTSRKILDLVDQSKSLVEDYIKGSSVLRDKEELISGIQDIKTKMADIKGAPAMYQDGNIYISRDSEDVVCEWMIVHELVHGLAVITNGGVENEPYPYSLFNEVITDVITKAMKPEIMSGILSGYIDYHEIALTYIGVFQEEAIKAYFYGYDSIWKEKGKDEVDLFVLSIDNYDSTILAQVCVNNSLLKWMRQAE